MRIVANPRSFGFSPRVSLTSKVQWKQVEPKQIKHITVEQFRNLLHYLEDGITLVKQERFRDSRDHFLAIPAKSSIGIESELEKVTAPHIPDDLELLPST